MESDRHLLRHAHRQRRRLLRAARRRLIQRPLWLGILQAKPSITKRRTAPSNRIVPLRIEASALCELVLPSGFVLRFPTSIDDASLRAVLLAPRCGSARSAYSQPRGALRQWAPRALFRADR